MDQAIQAYVANKELMGSVLVARGGTILLNKGYEFANLEWQISNTPKTKFQLDSLTNQFTAASVLLLEECGELQAKDPIGSGPTLDAPGQNPQASWN